MTLASLFCGRRNTLDRWRGKIAFTAKPEEKKWNGKIARPQNALVRGRQLLSQLSISKRVSQNCFVFDPVKLKRLRSLAELLGF